MNDDFGDVVHSDIWEEEAELDNPFAAAACYCRGYDVFRDLIGNASYIEYLFLLLKGEQPSSRCTAALEILAVAVGNPGPRDPSVHAAMAAAVGGSTSASALIAAISVGAGAYSGSRELYLVLEAWSEAGADSGDWCSKLTTRSKPTRMTVWPESEHIPGFDPYGTSCTGPVRHTLNKLQEYLPSGRVAWLCRERPTLEAAAGRPLAMNGVVGAAFADLGFTPEEGEMLGLLLRLPGAAAHALEQKRSGFRRFPFFSLDLENDPRSATEPEDE